MDQVAKVDRLRTTQFSFGKKKAQMTTYLHSLEKHLLLFDDKSTDLIKKEDFGTELYVLEDQQRRSQRSERKDYNALANGM